MANGLGYQRYADAAQFIGISETTLRRWVSKGRVPHYKISRAVFFDPVELKSFFDAHHVQAKKG